MKLKAALLFAFVAIGIFINTAALAGDGDMEKEILELVNRYRQKKNLPALEYDKAIAKAAEKHSENMADKRVSFGHGGFDERIDGLMAKIKGANAAAENVAYGSETAEEVVAMWLKSKGHKKNIEGKFNMTGIGIARDKNGRIYYTQIFINRK